ncbi:cytochrome b [Pseudomonas protegens]|uniref:cytochrome b n=1 Tax=Pseudomonas protegens TaxID=380021 RepID=UPI001F1BE087|nr:cytochrome b/b6 domain-containing protein [Pseudomonas protegens]
MKNHSYSHLQKVLHWLSAVVILWALISGFYVALFEVSAASKEWLAFFNVSLTTVFIPLFIWRLYLALTTRSSPVGQPRSFAESLAAIAHRAIYLAVIIVLITGVLMMNRPITVFDLFFIPQPLQDPYVIGLFFTVHVVSCAVLGLLVALHVAAVVKHEVAGRRVLKRMIWSVPK